MKTTYTIRRDCLCPPVPNRELELFTCAIQSPVTEKALKHLGVTIDESIDVCWNSGNDDPPDLEALGLGWECTEYPPNQSALEVVHRERRNRGMVVPPISKTGRSIQKVRVHASIQKTVSQFYSKKDEIDELERVFSEEIIGGPKSKDVPTNDILLLDNRGNEWDDTIPEEAATRVVVAARPRYIKVILLVRYEKQLSGDRSPVSKVVQVFPVNS